MRNSVCLLLVLLGLLNAGAYAEDIALAGLLPGKAIVVINGGKRQIIGVGEKTKEGVKLLSIEDGTAYFTFEGRQRGVQLGERIISSDSINDKSVTLFEQAGGHFYVDGVINNQRMRFLVDTGATNVALGAADADRLKLNWRKGRQQFTQTANGRVKTYLSKIPKLKIGNMVLDNVDVSVHTNSLPIGLLGMSVLKRMEIQREGSQMTLRQRY